jgi:hypothetical protein
MATSRAPVEDEVQATLRQHGVAGEWRSQAAGWRRAASLAKPAAPASSS